MIVIAGILIGMIEMVFYILAIIFIIQYWNNKRNGESK